jgi:hypothetical protein
MPYVVRPLDPWIGKFTGPRETSRFRSTWTATLSDLDRELRHLSVRDPMVYGRGAWVLQIDVREDQIRRDGGVHARANPASPAIRVCFTAPRLGDMTYAMDRFTSWQDNVRAVALTLQALRAVERYGVAKSGEQYRGWTAMSNRPAAMTREQAAEFIAHWAGAEAGELRAWADKIFRNVDGEAARAYRMAAKVAHPDVTRDDGDTMARLNVARDLLLNGGRRG